MFTNISENRHRAFEPLTGGQAGNFCLFAGYVELERRISRHCHVNAVASARPVL